MSAQFVVVAIASRYPAWAQTAENGYLKQLRSLQLRCQLSPAGGGAKKEARAALARLPKGGRCVALCADGNRVDSAGFARLLAKWMQEARQTAFVIGGANGMDKSLQEAAEARLSLSALTFPHALARLVLVEQIFRADCLLRNHPYPR